jgi:hypothetical protein
MYVSFQAAAKVYTGTQDVCSVMSIHELLADFYLA